MNFGTDQGGKNAFLLVKSTQVYGGFSPDNGAIDLASRNWRDYPTILDGNNSAYHVVVAVDLFPTNLFDGFIVQGGNANNIGSYTSYSRSVSHRSGGAMAIYESSISIQNCLFRNNHAMQLGGALYVSGNKATKIINSIFDSNTSDNEGLAIAAAYTTTSFEIINSTFYDDPATANNKSTILYSTAAATISNSIFHVASGSAPFKEYEGEGYAIYRNCYFNLTFWSDYWGVNSTGNILTTTNPFIDITNRDFRIKPCSNALDAGNNSYFPDASTALDYDGNDRVFGSAIDIGAIEYSATTNPGTISGVDILSYGDTIAYTTDGDAGGTWSSENGIVNIDANGEATPKYGHYGTDYIHYTFDIGGCIYDASFEITVQKPEITPDTSNIIYVDKNASNSLQTGDSWTNAVEELADALIWAKENESSYNASNILKIYVAEGSYSPLYSAQDGANFGTDKGVENSFALVRYTEVYGGFSPDNGATDLETRNWTDYPTILDGNDAVYHVVVANDMPSENVFDGFIVQGGNANSASFYNTNGKEVYHTRGGAMIIYESGITIQNCLFRNNNVSQWGGALSIAGTNTIKIINSIFDNNTAATNGLAIFALNTNANFEVINCSFYNESNDAGNKGTIAYFTGIATISNSIFYGGTNLFAKVSGSGNATYRSSYFNAASWNGDWGIEDGRNIFNTDSPFVDAANHDFNIETCSGALNGGDNSYLANASTATDYYGNDRVVGASIDMGAIENQASTPNTGTISGPVIIAQQDVVTYTTNGEAGGTWSSRNGIVSIDANGETSTLPGVFGTDVITYSIDSNGCIYSSSFNVTVTESSISPDANNTIYVDKNVVGGTESGKSWTNAIVELADALKWARQNESSFNTANPLKIFVAKGSYSPKYSANDAFFGTNAGGGNSFLLVKYTQVYGGFSPADGAVDLATRNWTEYPTILDGNNLYRHLVIANDLPSVNLFDGFIIQNGNAGLVNNYDAYNKAVADYRGGGMSINESDLTIQNCIFRNNTCYQYGGAISVLGGGATKIINSIFDSNTTNNNGLNIYAQNTTANFEIINCTFYNNPLTVGAKSTIYYYNGVATISNSIFFGGSTPFVKGGGTGDAIYQNSYFNVDSWNNAWGSNSGGNILNTSNPFMDAANQNFNLSICSDAVNAGDNSYLANASTATDYYGNERVFGSSIDMGAAESQSTPFEVGTISGKSTLFQGQTEIYTNSGIQGGVWSVSSADWSINSVTGELSAGTNTGSFKVFYTYTNQGCAKYAEYDVEVLASSIIPTNNTIYVDKSQNSGTGDGSSWATAVTELSDALIWAKENEGSFDDSNPLKIFVAEGSYSPLYSFEDSYFGQDRANLNTFYLSKNSQIYGGFSPSKGAVDLATRDWTNYPTILDGNDEVYHVLTAVNLPESNIIDGFIVDGGNAESLGVTIYNEGTVWHRNGGAIYLIASKMTIQNMLFRNNYALNNGGAVTLNQTEDTKIINSIFDSNMAGEFGAALSIEYSTDNIIITNCTFYNEPTSIGSKGTIHSASSSAEFYNSIIFGGSAPSLRNGGESATFSNCYFNVNSWTTSWGISQDANILNTSNPFIDASNGNFNLVFCSSAIDAGNNSYFANASTATDFYGKDRVVGSTIDMGAIESTELPVLELLPIGPFCLTDESEDFIVNITGGVFTGTGVSNGKFDPQLAGEGVHEITYTLTEGVCQISETIWVEVEYCVSTNIDTNKVNGIEIYPNPAKDVINATLSQSSYVQIIDITGRVVSNQNLTAGINSLSLKGLNDGVYLLQVLNGENRSIHKFVKK